MVKVLLTQSAFQDLSPSITCNNPAPYLRDEIVENPDSESAGKYIGVDTVILTYTVRNIIIKSLCFLLQ